MAAGKHGSALGWLIKGHCRNMAGTCDGSILFQFKALHGGMWQAWIVTPLERAHEADTPAVSTWLWAPTAAPTAMSERIASAPRQGMLRRAAPALDSAPRQAPMGLSP